ncbi:MAG TPA: SGNH/GDSL hydrolase family protein [Planctomycetota bacterium]|jgi:acyl-CoA thioesterase-1
MKLLFALVLLSTTCGALWAAEPGAATNVTQGPEKDDPKLPRVLIIGDSISIGYTDDVRKLLAGKANVHRINGNAGPSNSGVKKLSEWIDAKSGKWDVIHFNFGLHDIKKSSGGKEMKGFQTSDGHQVSAEDYDKNLREIVAKLKKTGAALIWCSTTPVPEGKLDPVREKGDEVKYNQIAAKIMAENAVAIDDLYAVALPRLAAIQAKANVHFSKEGSAELAKQVVASIEAALKTRK